jgi:hypothetical protein
MNKHIETAEFIADLLDNRFKILGFRFGLDPLIGIIPGLGSTVTYLLSFYIVWIAYELNMPKDKLAEMIKNITLDFILGLVPGVGNVADFFYKANIKNLKILKDYNSTFIDGEII